MNLTQRESHYFWKLFDKLVNFSRPTGHWFQLVVIISAVVASYLLSLSNRFTPEDTALASSELVTNPKTRLVQFFGSSCRRDEWGGPTYRPLTMMSLAKDYKKRGLDYVQFRRTNAVFHTMAALLVYWLTLRLTQRRGVALCVALLFAASPTSGSCVSYISHRGELLAAVGTLGSIALFDWALTLPKKWAVLAYGGSLLVLGAGLLSAETALLMPLFLLVYLAARGQRIEWKSMPWLGGLMAVELSYLALRYRALGGLGWAAWAPMNWSQRVVMWLRALGAGVCAWFSPVQVPVERSPAFDARNMALYFLVVGIVAILVAVVVLVRFRKRIPGAWCGMAWAVVGLLPLIPLVGTAGLLAEHWLYLAGIGTWMTVCCLGLAIVQRIRFVRASMSFMYLFMIVVIALQMGRAVRRNRDWRAEVSVIGQSLANTPKATLLHTRYGLSMAGNHLPGQAFKQFRVAISLDPKNILAHTELGIAYNEYGNVDEAIEEFRHAIRLQPTDPRKHYLLAKALGRKRRNVEAIAHCRMALALGTTIVDVYAQLAWHLATSPSAELRNGREAMELAKYALQKRNQNDAFSMDALAAACAEVGDFNDARQYAERAIKLTSSLGYGKYTRDIRTRLKLYMNGRPFRQNPDAPTSG